MRRHLFRYLSFMMFVLITITSLAGNSDNSDSSDATVTNSFEDMALEILAMDSFDDLFNLDGFFDENPAEEITPSLPIPLTPTSTGNLTEVETPNVTVDASSLDTETLESTALWKYEEYTGGLLPGRITFEFQSGDPVMGISDVVKFYKEGVVVDTLAGKTIMTPVIVHDVPYPGQKTTIFRFLTDDYSAPLGAYYITVIDTKVYSLTVAIDPKRTNNVIDLDCDGIAELMVVDDHMVKAHEATELSVFKRFFRWTENGWQVDSPGDYAEVYSILASDDLERIELSSPRTPHVWSYAYHSYMAGQDLEEIRGRVAELVEGFSLHWLIDATEMVKLLDQNINQYDGFVMKRPTPDSSPTM
ncbi:hypothetical protein [Mesotoga sp.]|uniref:hypothetical protein n=1 Tax=Mesotoga sp. TaxID=2053577 RepID=UPI0026041C97|nr:hypothetical protein [Mesotoga sp.]MDD4207932.1 hypothetical protein [Mesotoga sp.]